MDRFSTRSPPPGFPPPSAARAMVELSDLDRYYGNAIVIVCIHAVIAYNDALTVVYNGVKAAEGEHAGAADVLQSALGHRASVNLSRPLPAPGRRPESPAAFGSPSPGQAKAGACH